MTNPYVKYFMYYITSMINVQNIRKNKIYLGNNLYTLSKH